MIPSVILRNPDDEEEMTSGPYKYMLLTAKEKGSEKEETVLLAKKLTFFFNHRDLLCRAEEDFPQHEWEPKGGGKLLIDTDQKVIRIHDASQQYGRADQKKVKTLLKNAYPDFKITIA